MQVPVESLTQLHIRGAAMSSAELTRLHVDLKLWIVRKFQDEAQLTLEPISSSFVSRVARSDDREGGVAPQRQGTSLIKACNELIDRQSGNPEWITESSMGPDEFRP